MCRNQKETHCVKEISTLREHNNDEVDSERQKYYDEQNAPNSRPSVLLLTMLRSCMPIDRRKQMKQKHTEHEGTFWWHCAQDKNPTRIGDVINRKKVMWCWCRWPAARTRAQHTLNMNTRRPSSVDISRYTTVTVVRCLYTIRHAKGSLHYFQVEDGDTNIAFCPIA